jgi:hypothetical protein
LRLTSSFDARDAAKRPQREKRELKVLDGKWDSDNRHRQCDRQADVAEKDPKAREQKPQDVTERSKEGDALVARNVLSEGQQSDARDLEALYPERDADDGDAKNDTDDNVFEPDDEAPAENDPQEIQKYSKHCGVS